MKTQEETKIDWEIKHLQLDYMDKKKNRKWDKFRTANSFIGYILALIIASYQVMNPLVEYLKEKARQDKFQLNSDMITLVNSGDDDPTRLRAATMLTYYDYNSVPILIYFMENVSDATAGDATIHLISKVYGRLTKDEALKTFIEIHSSFQFYANKIVEPENDSELDIFKRYLKLFKELDKNLSDNQHSVICLEYEKNIERFQIDKLDWYVNSLKWYKDELCSASR